MIDRACIPAEPSEYVAEAEQALVDGDSAKAITMALIAIASQLEDLLTLFESHTGIQPRNRNGD